MLTVLAVGFVAGAVRTANDDPTPVVAPGPSDSDRPSDPGDPDPSASDTAPPVRAIGVHGGPFGETIGLTMFRGNPTRNWYGTGPMGSAYEIAWRYPDSPMCSQEVLSGGSVEGSSHSEVRPAAEPSQQPTDPPPTQPEPTEPQPTEPQPTEPPPTEPQPTEPGPSQTPSPSPRPPVVKLWCGSGWTGQPAIWVRPDGVTELAVGTYDRRVHFLDVATGQPTRPAFPTGDIIKGSVTIDPDGFPLLYTGSRDNKYRAIALDRDTPTELFALTPHPQGIWNNDWDGNGVIVDGILYEGGEDSWFRAVELNRTIDAEGRVQVAPEVLVEIPGFDNDLFSVLGDRNVSIETSPLVVGDRVYFANSGGLIQGYDTSRVRDGEFPQTLRFWAGDDIDATLVADEDGFIYAAVEYERKNERARTLGQLLKLDPDNPDDPLVWGLPIPPRGEGGDGNGGLWATPALYGEYLYVTTHAGDLIVVDRRDGAIVWSERIGYHEWSSPVVVDDTLVVALCDKGGIRGYSLADPSAPTQQWEVVVPSGACIESTPAVWEGRLYVGSRDGYLYSFAPS